MAFGTGLLWNYLLEAADPHGDKRFHYRVSDLSEKWWRLEGNAPNKSWPKSSQPHAMDLIPSEIIKYCASSPQTPMIIMESLSMGVLETFGIRDNKSSTVFPMRYCWMGYYK